MTGRGSFCMLLVATVGISSAAAAACAHGDGRAVDAATVHVVVQAPTTEQAERAAALVGGTVTHRLAIIHSVGATVTGRQLVLLGHGEGVQFHEGRPVDLTKDQSEGITRGNGGSEPVGRQPTDAATAGSGISDGE